MKDSFYLMAEEKYPQHSKETKALLANAMRVWFGYEKPYQPNRIERFYLFLLNIRDKFK